MQQDLWGMSISSAEDSRAKISALLGSELDWLANEVDFSSTHSLSQRMSKRQGSSWRMCQDFYQATKDAISESSSLNWPTQGMATSDGVFLIRSSSEWPNAGAVSSSLREVIQQEVSDKYSLSPKAAAGILRRATKRGKTLPEPLETALTQVAALHPTVTE